MKELEMKKTILTGASILALSIAAPALGQNISDVDQTGAGNNAGVTQSGDGNDSDVDQDGDSNTATVGQDGTDGVAGVLQTGNSNTTTIDQTSIEGFIDVVQDGDSNIANVTQNDASGNDSIGIQPTGTADPEARINQLGNGNDSSIDQTNVTGSFNLIADNNQNGDDNISTITQGANGPGFTGTLRATVNQTNGADSTVTQDANNGSKNFNATVTQDDSISVVTQTGNASTGTNNPALRAIVNQTGGSDSTIDQTVNGAGGGDLFADVD